MSKKSTNESTNNKKGGGYKTTKKHRDTVEKYDRKNTTSVRLKLNKKTDKDILEKLDKSGNKQGTIKNALRGGKSKKKKK
jgi:hypothetical protein